MKQFSFEKVVQVFPESDFHLLQNHFTQSIELLTPRLAIWDTRQQKGTDVLADGLSARVDGFR